MALALNRGNQSGTSRPPTRCRYPFRLLCTPLTLCLTTQELDRNRPVLCTGIIRVLEGAVQSAKRAT